MGTVTVTHCLGTDGPYGIRLWTSSLRAIDSNLVEGESALRVDCIPAGEGLPAADGGVDETRLDLHRACVRPTRSAAMIVVPDPQNVSSTMSPRRVQSLRASATSATGLAVECDLSSSMR